MAVAGQDDGVAAGGLQRVVEPFAGGRIAVPAVQVERHGKAEQPGQLPGVGALVGRHGGEHPAEAGGARRLDQVRGRGAGDHHLVAEQLPGGAGLHRAGELGGQPLLLPLAQHAPLGTGEDGPERLGVGAEPVGRRGLAARRGRLHGLADDGRIGDPPAAGGIVGGVERERHVAGPVVLQLVGAGEQAGLQHHQGGEVAELE